MHPCKINPGISSVLKELCVMKSAFWLHKWTLRGDDVVTLLYSGLLGLIMLGNWSLYLFRDGFLPLRMSSVCV